MFSLENELKENLRAKGSIARFGSARRRGAFFPVGSVKTLPKIPSALPASKNRPKSHDLKKVEKSGTEETVKTAIRDF